ncbi:hypothetical protein I7I50_11051 [Histoplasma capsulatum G186AR]|uniref:Uncharacterized protein n=1 Tax=Ajellomyces capsulatus TaxID=5037 RepID=A0A8H7ZA88_AJECA|nr:hypothetical protein I7I52_02290 [Histoplasma capsulatum]QSS69678.1 hypothetical protein I7I50_11051 [Histoplasma capsulatum G186AR]
MLSCPTREEGEILKGSGTLLRKRQGDGWIQAGCFLAILPPSVSQSLLFLGMRDSPAGSRPLLAPVPFLPFLRRLIRNAHEAKETTSRPCRLRFCLRVL